jgi:transposase
MPKKQKSTKKGASGTNSSAEQLAALQKEVEYLRAENAFLKKLEALIQQQEAAKAQSKQQKPSRN